MDEGEILIQELLDARKKLFDVIDQFDPTLEVYPRWTIKELLAHLAGWDDAVIDKLTAFVTGQPLQSPAIRGINFYNAKSVEERESLDLEHIRRECERTRQQVIALLRQVPPEKLHDDTIFPWSSHGTITQMIHIFIHHEGEEHYTDMLALYHKLHPDKK